MVARFLLAGLAAVCAGCSPVVDAEFSRIEVSRPDIQIPGVPSAQVTSVTFNFSIDSSGLGASYKPDSQDNITEVKLHRLAFTAKSGISDVSFIQSLHALACVPTSKTSSQSSRQVEIADYARDSSRQDAAPPAPTFEVPLPEPVNLLPLLRTSQSEPKRILVIVNLGGTLPTVDWKADVAMSLSVKFRQ
jgi:hypothetical protein